MQLPYRYTQSERVVSTKGFLTGLMRCCGFSSICGSAGMYASQIWSTQLLDHDNVFSKPLQIAHMAFIKRILKVKSTCKLVFASRMRTGTLAILLAQVSCQILE